jgi:hypothetical protein
LKGTFLIFDINGETIKAFEFAQFGKNLNLVSFSQYKSGEGRGAEDYLRGFEKKSYSGGVYCMAASEKLVFKTISLPVAGEDKVSRIIRFEAEKFLPYPAAEAALGFLKIEKRKRGSDVFISAARKKEIESIVEIFNKTALKPAAIVPDIMYIPELLRVEIPFMYIQLEDGMLRICVFKNKMPFIIKSISLSSGLSAEGVKETVDREAGVILGVCEIRESGCGIKKVYVSGNNIRAEDVKYSLSRKFGLETEQADVLHKINHSLNEEEALSAGAALFEAAGLASAAAAGRRIINLEETKQKKNWRESPVFTASAGIIVILLAVLSVFIKLKEKETQLLGIKSEIYRTVEGVLGTGDLSGRSEIEIISILRERVEARSSMSGALQKIGTGDALEALREIVQSVSVSGEAVITGINIGSDVCLLDGRTESFRAMEELFKVLSESKFFKKASISRAQADSSSGGVVFRIELVPPGEV